MQKPVLLIMARWPAPFRCKKRLATDIGAKNAALIQAQLNAHTLAVAMRLKGKGLVNPKLAIEGIGAKKAKRLQGTLGLEEISTQGKGNLGLKMKKQLMKIQRERSFNRSKGVAIVIIGTDLPNLSELDIITSLQELSDSDIVIGPALDGGFWLIGFSEKLLSEMYNVLFDGISWGTQFVLNQMIQKIQKQGLKYQLIGYKNDLDKISDLQPWLA